MSTIESIKELVNGLHRLVNSGCCDTEMYCLDGSGNRLAGASELAISDPDERLCLASVMVLDDIRDLIADHYHCFEFDTVRNESNDPIVFHGVRVIATPSDCVHVARDRVYTDPRQLLPDDELDISVGRTVRHGF